VVIYFHWNVILRVIQFYSYGKTRIPHLSRCLDVLCAANYFHEMVLVVSLLNTILQEATIFILPKHIFLQKRRFKKKKTTNYIALIWTKCASNIIPQPKQTCTWTNQLFHFTFSKEWTFTRGGMNQRRGKPCLRQRHTRD
jgi:hypothetical protein